MRTLLALGLLLFSARAFADGVPLVQASDYLARAAETQLSFKEAQYLADRRKDSFSAEIVKLNMAAFDTGVVTVFLQGVVHEFVGAKTHHPPVREDFPGAKPGEPKFVMHHHLFSWFGRSKSGGEMSLSWAESVYGTISDGPRHSGSTRYYTLSNAGGKSSFHVLYERRPSTRPAHDPVPPVPVGK